MRPEWLLQVSNEIEVEWCCLKKHRDFLASIGCPLATPRHLAPLLLLKKDLTKSYPEDPSRLVAERPNRHKLGHHKSGRGELRLPHPTSPTKKRSIDVGVRVLTLRLRFVEEKDETPNS